MGTKERKERERENQRNLILQAAGEIFAKEGIEKLSIRKIANKIEYSPAIIYHYFKDKEDIVNHLMARGYQKIMGSLSSLEVNTYSPEEKLRELMRNYIKTALDMPDEFMAVQLSKSPAIREYTSTLFKGASSRKPALAILTECLKEIFQHKNVDDDIIELTAQSIAASSIGLIIKLIIEKDIGEEQKNKLIDHYINLMIKGTLEVGLNKE